MPAMRAHEENEQVVRLLHTHALADLDLGGIGDFATGAFRFPVASGTLQLLIDVEILANRGRQRGQRHAVSRGAVAQQRRG